MKMEPIIRKRPTKTGGTTLAPPPAVVEPPQTDPIPIPQNNTSIEPTITGGTTVAPPPAVVEPPQTDPIPENDTSLEPIIVRQDSNNDSNAVMSSLDKKVNALVDYLEHWIGVGNVSMSDIQAYIQSKL